MKTITYLSLIISALVLTACKGIPIGDYDDSKEEVLYINNHKVECDSFQLQLCLQIRSNESDDWELFDENISGLSYQWGHDYKLEVEVKDTQDPTEDNPSKTYKWVKTLSNSTTSQEAFEISVSRNPINGLIKKTADDRYKIYNDKEIKCSTTDCEKLESFRSNDRAVVLSLKHNNNPSEPLDLINIVCDAPRDTFEKTKVNGGCF
jgi:hypothetical protein